MRQILRDRRAERARGDNGFTLIELLVVVVILGVLIAIAIPVYLNYRKGANDAAAESDVRNAISTLEVCNSTNGKYPVFSAAQSWAYSSTSTSAVPCTGQLLSLSTGTTIKYVANTAGACYSVFATNAGGAGRYWSYSSLNGGAVSGSNTAAAATAYTAAAVPTC